MSDILCGCSTRRVIIVMSFLDSISKVLLYIVKCNIVEIMIN